MSTNKNTEDIKIIKEWIEKFKKEDKNKPVDIAKWLVINKKVTDKERLDNLVKWIYFEI